MRTLIQLTDLPATLKLVRDSCAVGCSHIINFLEFPYTSGNQHTSPAKVAKFSNALRGFLQTGRWNATVVQPWPGGIVAADGEGASGGGDSEWQPRPPPMSETSESDGAVDDSETEVDSNVEDDDDDGQPPVPLSSRAHCPSPRRRKTHRCDSPHSNSHLRSGCGGGDR